MNSPNIAGKCDGTHVKMVKLAKLHSCKKNPAQFQQSCEETNSTVLPNLKNRLAFGRQYCNSFIVAMPSSPRPPMFSFNINSSRDFPV